MQDEVTQAKPLSEKLARLTMLSRKNLRSVYSRFDWQESLDDSSWWMSPELLSIHGTRFFEESTEQMRRQLSKWECINLFSINVHGIRELLLDVIRRMHTRELAEANEYLHHFVEEENQHMWYFAEFCERYGGKIYANKKAKLNPEKDPLLETFLVFARIYVFEEVGDYYNVLLAKDERVLPLVRNINQAHHEDESRHIAFGRALMLHLTQRLVAEYPAETVADMGRKVLQFMQLMLETLYNPTAYRDAGFQNGLAIRNEVLATPARPQRHRIILDRANKLFIEAGLLKKEEINGMPCFSSQA